jgi:hypothetical protein
MSGHEELTPSAASWVRRQEEHDQRQRAQSRFAARYPKFFGYLVKCLNDGGMFEAYVYPKSDSSKYASIGIRGHVNNDYGLALDIVELTSSLHSAQATCSEIDHISRYDTPTYPVSLWDAKGEPSSEMCMGCRAEYFPYHFFLIIGEKEGYTFVNHPGLKWCGEEIYSAIKKLIRNTTRPQRLGGKKLTEKQLLTEISNIIADITDNDDLRDSFQDDTDHGFSSDEAERED